MERSDVGLYRDHIRTIRYGATELRGVMLWGMGMDGVQISNIDQKMRGIITDLLQEIVLLRALLTEAVKTKENGVERELDEINEMVSLLAGRAGMDSSDARKVIVPIISLLTHEKFKE